MTITNNCDKIHINQTKGSDSIKKQAIKEKIQVVIGLVLEYSESQDPKVLGQILEILRNLKAMI